MFYLRKLLGTGGYSVVYEADLNGVKVAAKALKKENHKLNEKEISILKRLNHDNIITLYGILTTNSYTFILTTLCSVETMFDKVENESMSIEEVTRYCGQLVSAVIYIHSQGIVHLDLKLENIFELNGLIKLGDFGLSQIISDKPVVGFCGGTLGYVAPEINTISFDGFKADAWSLGVCLFCMVFRFFPFDPTIAQSKDWRFQKVKNAQDSGVYDTCSTLLSCYKKKNHCTTDMTHFLNSLLTIEPGKRLTVVDAFPKFTRMATTLKRKR